MMLNVDLNANDDVVVPVDEAAVDGAVVGVAGAVAELDAVAVEAVVVVVDDGDVD